MSLINDMLKDLERTKTDAEPIFAPKVNVLERPKTNYKKLINYFVFGLAATMITGIGYKYISIPKAEFRTKAEVASFDNEEDIQFDDNVPELPIAQLDDDGNIDDGFEAEDSIEEEVKQASISAENIIERNLADAKKFISGGFYTSAEKLLNENLRLNSTALSSSLELSELYWQTGRQSQSVNVLATALDYNPANVKVSVKLAEKLHILKDDQSAWNLMASLKDKDLNNNHLSLRAYLAQQVHEHDAALRDYSLLNTRNPKIGKWWIGKALSEKALKQDKSALNSFNKAVSCDDLNFKLKDFVNTEIKHLERKTG